MYEWIPFVVVLLVVIFSSIIIYPVLRFRWYEILHKSSIHYPSWAHNLLWLIFYGLYACIWYRATVTPLANIILLNFLFGIVLWFILLWMILLFYWRKLETSIIMCVFALIMTMVIMVLCINDPLTVLLLSIVIVWIIYLIYITYKLF